MYTMAWMSRSHGKSKITHRLSSRYAGSQSVALFPLRCCVGVKVLDIRPPAPRPFSTVHFGLQMSISSLQGPPGCLRLRASVVLLREPMSVYCKEVSIQRSLLKSHSFPRQHPLTATRQGYVAAYSRLFPIAAPKDPNR
jgi:hypothetical protein